MSNNDKKNRSGFFKALLKKESTPIPVTDMAQDIVEIKKDGFMKQIRLGKTNMDNEYLELLNQYNDMHEDVEELASKIQLLANMKELKEENIELDESLNYREQAKKAKREYIKSQNGNKIVNALGGAEVLWNESFVRYIDEGLLAELELIRDEKDVPEEKKEAHQNTSKLFRLLESESSFIGVLMGMRHAALESFPLNERIVKTIKEIELQMKSEEKFGDALAKTSRNAQTEKSMEERLEHAMFGRVNGRVVVTHNESFKKYQELIKTHKTAAHNPEIYLEDFVKESTFTISDSDVMKVYEEAQKIKKEKSKDIITKNNDDIITR